MVPLYRWHPAKRALPAMLTLVLTFSYRRSLYTFFYAWQIEPLWQDTLDALSLFTHISLGCLSHIEKMLAIWVNEFGKWQNMKTQKLTYFRMCCGKTWLTDIDILKPMGTQNISTFGKSIRHKVICSIFTYLRCADFYLVNISIQDVSLVKHFSTRDPDNKNWYAGCPVVLRDL